MKNKISFLLIVFLVPLYTYAESDSFIKMKVNGEPYEFVDKKSHRDDKSGIRIKYTDFSQPKKIWVNAFRYEKNQKGKWGAIFALELYIPKPPGEHALVDTTWSSVANCYKSCPQINLKLFTPFVEKAVRTTNGKSLMKNAADQGNFVINYQLGDGFIEGTFQATLHRYGEGSMKNQRIVVSRNEFKVTDGEFKIYIK